MRSDKNAKFKVAECRKIEVDELFSALKLLNGVVFGTDGSTRRKFKLATVEIRPRNKPERRKKKETENSQQQLPLGRGG